MVLKPGTALLFCKVHNTIVTLPKLVISRRPHWALPMLHCLPIAQSVKRSTIEDQKRFVRGTTRKWRQARLVIVRCG